MSAFAHKDDKGKINLGNESDLTGIGDGTAFGAIKAINVSLSDIINPTSVSITSDGSTSYKNIFNSLFALIDTSKVKRTSQLVIETSSDTTYFDVAYYSSSGIRVSCTTTNTSDGKIYVSGITLEASNSMWKIGIMTEPSTLSVVNQSAGIAPSGRTFRFIY